MFERNPVAGNAWRYNKAQVYESKPRKEANRKRQKRISDSYEDY